MIKASDRLLGVSPVMKNVVAMLEKAAPRPVTVLLTGETGTGKELAARMLHDLSPQKNKPFVAINCATITETLMESELFGHERGSFTGAVGQHQGAFEQADGGTLLLDEVTEIPLHLQAKLLRVLQEGEIRRVGGKKTIPVDVRVIAATNRDLAKTIEEKRFRPDLFYRLDVVRIGMPSLREHPEDIHLLAEHFRMKVGASLGIDPLPEFSSSAIKVMLAHSWPGNVRELERCITRALVFSDRKISPENLAINHKDEIGNEAALAVAKTARTRRRRVQRQDVLEAVSACGGSRTQAAKTLGVSVQTVRRHLQIERERSGQAFPAVADLSSPWMRARKELEEAVARVVAEESCEPHRENWPSWGDKSPAAAKRRVMLVAAALNKTELNRSEAARMLGISEALVYYWTAIMRRIYTGR